MQTPQLSQGLRPLVDHAVRLNTSVSILLKELRADGIEPVSVKLGTRQVFFATDAEIDDWFARRVAAQKQQEWLDAQRVKQSGLSGKSAEVATAVLAAGRKGGAR